MSDIFNEDELLLNIAQAPNEAELEGLRVSLLGKKGLLSGLLAELGKLDMDTRKSRGAALNQQKEKITAALEARRKHLKQEALQALLLQQQEDVTLPLAPSATQLGRLHPINFVMDELIGIFRDLGFAVAEGPDIETEDYNFSRLNFPIGHPAREMHDTFFFDGVNEAGDRHLLRTHTSPVQVRTMLTQAPPIRVICPGRTYRCDSDQTHTPMFHQLEGLVIDKSANLSQLMWLLEEFCKRFFEVPSLKMRFRPSFFPFTTPSLEVDIQCSRRHGEIKFGEGEEWMEILGCGMVHPNVLESCNLDPNIYQGFAWGVGIDRIAMLKYGIDDLRAFFDGDVRFLRHFGFGVFE